MKGCLIVLLMTVILSCNNTRGMSASSFDQYARTEQVSDSFLLSLQQQNEVVIAFAVESYAWVRSVDYKIITLNKGVWKGYTYYRRITGGASEKHETISVSNDSCNAVWKFIQTNEAWKIKGDSGKDFCSGSEKRIVILTMASPGVC
jgi:glucose-6-phosphate 1-dehydrogenase